MSASATAVLVGLFGLHTITRRVATVISRSIACRSWRSSIERDRHRARAGGGGEVRVHGERRPRVHQLRARLQQRLAGGQQDVARAVADRDPRTRHAVAVAQLLRSSELAGRGSG